MTIEKYAHVNRSIRVILSWIESDEIAIPEIQRPFVWKKTQVRDLLDSLYKGYPVGYLTIWKSPNIRLKDGKTSKGEKILIDGQQRVTALMAAILGIEIVNSDYKKERVKIAFNPEVAFTDDSDAEIFAVQDASHLKSKNWIPDISVIFRKGFRQDLFVKKYLQDNDKMEEENLNEAIARLMDIKEREIGVIELSDILNMDVVTDIFIRINSKGTALSQGDFVMSKIAADEEHGGNNLRKAIDYFAHLSKVPSFYDRIKENDSDFANTEYFRKIEWLKNEIEDVYDPDYDDVLRVAFMHKYPRAKLSELVSLLSGRDFETREYREDVILDTYVKLKDGVLNVFNENNFKQFMIAIRSAGFISKKLVNSQMALDFAYTLYLILKQEPNISTGEYNRLVQKWYVLSVLTGRYSSSPESAFAKDIRLINEQGVIKTLHDMEAATLSEEFWNIAVVQDLIMTSTNNPTYLVYLAAQVKMNDVSLLSHDVLVKDLINDGDVHHIFPKEYLKSHGHEKSSYNQEGNYAFLNTQVNKTIGKKAPNEYFQEAKKQCETGIIKIGSITNYDELLENLEINCIPEDIFDMDYTNYEEFLKKRRELMAKKIRTYYESL